MPLQQEERPFRDWWVLHALRYGLILVGVLMWLWEARAVDGVVVGSVLLSLLVLLELPLYGLGRLPRHALWGVLQTAIGAAAFWIVPGLPAAFILAAVISGVAATLPLSGAIACLAAAAGVTVAALWDLQQLNSSPGLLGLYVLAAWVGRLFAMHLEENKRHRQTVRELEEAQKRLARLAETTRELAAVEERQRLAEEIHDSLGHALVATLLQVQVVKKLTRTDAEAAEKRLSVVEQNVRQTLDTVRKALQRGRRNRADLPLHHALESLAADFQAAGGPEVQLMFRPDPESVSDVSPQVADVLYRTVQEALTNAVRHGQAQLVRIEAEVVGPRLYLRIVDDGVGADDYSPGMGLSGMIGRVQSIGGTLRFETALGKGFQVEVGVMRR